MREFEAPAKTLGDLSADMAGKLIAAAADVALIIDDQGVIRDLAFGSDDLLREGYYEWLGKPWADTVTVESRPKVEALLRESRANAAPRWRHINHPSLDGADLPLSYSAIALPQQGGRGKPGVRSVVFGRDLRANAALQQRLISAQQAMERDYWRLRHMETRYRSLFQVASEAVLILDAVTGKLEEANPAALALFGVEASRPGWLISDSFEVDPGAKNTASVPAMLGRVSATGHVESVGARLKGQGEMRVSASLFRQEKTAHLLVRVSPLDTAIRTGGGSAGQSALMKLIEGAPDAFVVTDLDGLIMTANHAFLDLAELATETQVRGQSLERWLGRTGVDLNVLITNLRQRGAVRLFATVMRGEYGASTEVEISGVAVTEGEQPCLGFTIRDVSRRLVAEVRTTGTGREMPRSVGQMTELVGRVPLKDIVRDTTDLIEQLCIEAALELTHDNRASAAEMLGLSRQSLYVKLRRFNIGDLTPVPGEE
ncbi:transcriptional regulator PpsR [Rhizobacter sp. Root404]|uniref:transcriptional regulator PpsR n=1 Tax=Rhizobacter sp. Root404 TaxID=1736528 RepID=UPI0006FECDF8|nr:transcriptional regulator PpsR [Rhizobacter sp. Root404]KQW40329.1 transcriptional regulator PpsR [Rhizobacter sp. Root404]